MGEAQASGSDLSCHMKRFLTFLLLNSSAVTLAGEEGSRLIFPPFAKEDVVPLERPLSEYLLSPPDLPPLPGRASDEQAIISNEQLRGIMTNGSAMDQGMAMRELMKRGDEKTLLRLVYSLKQGNVAAEGILTLNSSRPLVVTPYLMEDVAHGSLEYYGIFSKGDGMFGEGRVRKAAVKLVASTLAHAPEFTGETRACLRAIRSGNESFLKTLSDESRYLIQWWLLNENAFEAGKWQDTRPLPQEITYLHPKDDTPFLRNELWDPEKQPPFGSPAWELSESFEAWSERIVDPKRRNLDFVALSWDGTKVIEHPAKSLDPNTRPGSPQDRESRKTPAPRSPPVPENDGEKKGISWVIAATIMILILSIIRWVRRKPAAVI